MTKREIKTLRAICHDLLHAVAVGESEGLLDDEEAEMSRDLANEGIAILSDFEAKLK